MTPQRRRREWLRAALLSTEKDWAVVGSEERMQPFLLIMLDNSIDTNLVRLRQDETQASDGNYELNRVTTPGQTTKLYLRIMYKDLVWHCFIDGWNVRYTGWPQPLMEHGSMHITFTRMQLSDTTVTVMQSRHCLNKTKVSKLFYTLVKRRMTVEIV